MAILTKIDSNVTGLRIAEEASLKVLPASPKWEPREPNSYADFGGQITTVARDPINPDRQLKKGVTTDLDAAAGWSEDLTQKNFQNIGQGYLFAALRRKTETFERTNGRGVVTFSQVPFTNVNGAGVYTLSNLNLTVAVVAAGGAGYVVGDVLTLVGGTFTEAAQVTVLTAPAGVVATVSITRAGRYTVAPGNPVATSGGTGAGCTITATITAGALTFVVNQLVFHAGFTNAANNGLKRLTAVTTTTYTTAEASVVEVPSLTTATSTVVGFQAVAGDFDIDASGSLPALVAGAKDLTTLGVIPGEWVFLGGDAAIDQFNTAVNNGFKRVRSVVAARMEFDKSDATMITEANAADTIRIFFGRVLKNETGALIQRRTYQQERTLGAPDDALPADEQAEYVIGGVPSTVQMNIPSADKVTMDYAFVNCDAETNDGPTPLKSGSRPVIEDADAFNTSSDFTRLVMAQVVAGNPAPSPLFAFVTDITLNLDNNVTPNKAIKVLGAFEVTAGKITVTGNLTAYFADVAAVAAVRNNADVTIDFAMVKQNSGILVDIPLMALGDARANVEADQPITLPIEMSAASGSKIHANLNHTILFDFFDYLPNAAQ